MLQSLKKILRADSEKFYEVEKITDPQIHGHKHKETNQ